MEDAPYFEGLDEYAEGTHDCRGYEGCLYLQNGRCIFSIAPIKQDHSRACYDDERMADMESEADYLMGCLDRNY